MIINTGARTDTVQWYTPWLLKRFEEGYVLVRNPLFPNKVTCYELTPEVVDVVEFCSKNYAPILSHLRKITDRSTRTSTTPSPPTDLTSNRVCLASISPLTRCISWKKSLAQNAFAGVTIPYYLRATTPLNDTSQPSNTYVRDWQDMWIAAFFHLWNCTRNCNSICQNLFRSPEKTWINWRKGWGASLPISIFRYKFAAPTMTGAITASAQADA